MTAEGIDDDVPAEVTIVNGANEAERLGARVTRHDELHLWVEGPGGVERRFSRVSGFEHPPGGSWSPWRLAGRDRRKVRTIPPPPPTDGDGSG